MVFVLPHLVMIISILAQVDVADFTYINSLIIWMPVVSSLSTLVLLPVFRNRIIRLFKKVPKKATATLSTFISAAF